MTTKTIKHGGGKSRWTFELGSKCNIYSNDIESYESNKFNHYVGTENKQNQSANDKLTSADLEDFRRAALIHKIARKKALSMLYSGAKLADLVEETESTIIKLCKQDLQTYFLKGSPTNNIAGIAFPIGVNINNIVAHDSKISSIHGSTDDRTFFKGDVVKIDIGVHVNGRIIDSAFTHIVTDEPGVHDESNIYNSVLEASRDSVFNAIKMSGPDQLLTEISESIDEIIKSYEVDMAGETLEINPVKGIGGHNIKRFQVHGGKLLLSEPDYEVQGDQRMEDDEIYAVETYASTGYGVMTQNSDMALCTHFMEANKDDVALNKAITKKDKKFFKRTELSDWLQTRMGLPFSYEWIDHTKIPKVEKALKLGIPSGQIIAYPPMFDEKNSVVAQFEHTIHVKDNSVEIFSIGEDY